MDLSEISEELGEIDGQISDIFRFLSNGFQKLEKVKDPNRRSRQLEDLTDKMRECKRLIKEFDGAVKKEEGRNAADTNKMLSDKKQSMIKQLNSFVALKKQYASSLDTKRIDLFDGPTGEGYGEENVLLASNMTNQQLMDNGHQMMDETDQAIERSKKVVEDTVNVGAETAAALKAQTEQMSRIVNELDSIHFSIKKASKLVKEIGRQVATDRCIMAMLFLVVIGVIAIIIVKNLTSCNDNLKRSVISGGGIQSILAYLGGPLPQESAVGALRNIVSVISTDKIISLDILPRLVHVLKKGSVGARQAAASAICKISNCMEMKRLVGEHGCLPLLLSLLEADSNGAREVAAQAISSLMSCPQNKREVKKHKRSVSSLVQLLDPSPQNTAKKYVVHCLLFLVSSRKCKRIMISHGAIGYLKKLSETDVQGAKKLFERLEKGDFGNLFSRK